MMGLPRGRRWYLQDLGLNPHWLAILMVFTRLPGLASSFDLDRHLPEHAFRFRAFDTRGFTVYNFDPRHPDNN